METFTPKEAPSLLGALRICFLRVDQSKILNCVPDSAAAQHVETCGERKRVYSIIKGGFGCQGTFLCGW